MKRLEFNDWRFKTDELLAHYTVLIQKQLYDLLISKGYKISYQKFNDYLRKNTMITRRKLFDSSNALMVMFKGKSLSRFKCLELILMNTYLIEKDLRTGFVYDGDFYRGVRALVKKFVESNKVPEEQKEAMKTQRDLYQAFINIRNAVLKGHKVESQKDETLFNSLYSRGIHFRTASNNILYFIITDKHDNLTVSKIVQAVVDLQEQYETRMKMHLQICLDVVCISDRKRQQLQKQFDKDFNELYRKEVMNRRIVLFKDPIVNVHASNVEKYVSNIERYIIA